MYHIDVKITESGTDPWRLSCFYGEAQTQSRHQTWDLMRGICSLSALPWLCIGDFNEVLRLEEHQGVANRSNAQIQGFRDAVDDCMLMDVGYQGRFWTFEKKSHRRNLYSGATGSGTSKRGLDVQVPNGRSDTSNCCYF